MRFMVTAKEWCFSVLSEDYLYVYVVSSVITNVMCWVDDCSTHATNVLFSMHLSVISSVVWWVLTTHYREFLTAHHHAQQWLQWSVKMDTTCELLDSLISEYCVVQLMTWRRSWFDQCERGKLKWKNDVAPRVLTVMLLVTIRDLFLRYE